MNVLALGDVVSSFGCSFLRAKLPGLKKFYGADLCIVNGENSADGNGITPASADYLIYSGVDIITTGNHCFRHREVYDYLDENRFVLRPCNYPQSAPGRGIVRYDAGAFQVGVVNLLGTVNMDNLENPFLAADKAIEELSGCRFIIVDFHAEATSEKIALANYLDGRASAVFGTHTHVRTADERVLPGGTGYITDLGMCGAVDSVLGVKKDIIINKFLTNMPARFDTETQGERMINGCLFELDDSTGKCLKATGFTVT